EFFASQLECHHWHLKTRLQTSLEFQVFSNRTAILGPTSSRNLIVTLRPAPQRCDSAERFPPRVFLKFVRMANQDNGFDCFAVKLQKGDYEFSFFHRSDDRCRRAFQICG